MSHLEYKHYLGSAEVDVENGTLFGRLLFIKDVIGYSGASVADLRQAFEEALDDYLEVCAERGEQPDVPCKGSFNVRIGAERRRVAAMKAREKGLGLNEYVCRALDEVARAVTVINRYEVTVTAASAFEASTASPPRWEVTSGSLTHQCQSDRSWVGRVYTCAPLTSRSRMRDTHQFACVDPRCRILQQGP